MGDGADETPAPTEAVKRAFESGRAYAEAEFERQKLRAGMAVAGARDISILATIGLLLALAIIAALPVGLILALIPLIGAWLALAAVIGGGLIVLAILVLLIRARYRRMMESLRG